MTQIIPVQSSPNYGLGTPFNGGSPGSFTPGYAEPDEGIHVGTLLGMVRRRWPLVVGIFVFFVALSYAVTRVMRPVYKASTTLYFAEQQSSIPALDILNKIEEGNGEVATEMEVMRSRALAEIVMDSLGLQATVDEPRRAITSQYIRVVAAGPAVSESHYEFSKDRGGSFLIKDLGTGDQIGSASTGVPFKVGNAMLVLLPRALEASTFDVSLRSRDEVVDELGKNIKVARPNVTASVVQVSYTDQDPVRARDVPNVLAKSYLAWRSSLRKSGDRSTVQFLKEQIDTISVQLFAAEEALRRFRQENQLVDLPTQATSEVQGMAALEAQKADVDVQRVSLKRLLQEAKAAPSDPRLGSPYRRLMAFPSLMTPANPALPLLETLTGLEQRRADLLVRRTQSDPDVVALTASINDVEAQIAAVVDTYVKGLDEQATSLAAQIGDFSGRAAQVPRREVQYARLDRSATGLTQIYTMLQTRLREAQIAEAVDDGSVRIVDAATIPVTPVTPRPVLNLLLGALLGILAAFGAVTLRERLDHSVHSKEDVEAVSGAPVLALIPHIKTDGPQPALRSWAMPVSRAFERRNGKAVSDHGQNARLLLKDPQSVASEAFRKLRTNITFARPDAPPRVLVFTSPAPGDGKSTSVMNLAIALVQQGKKVIVIDADMRRGSLHKLLSTSQSPGLSEILVGQADIENAVQSVSLETFGGVHLLPTGVIPPNPAELLTSPKFRGLIESLRPGYDAVLIDSPPINLVTDAAIIGRETDGVVFVVRAAKTTRAEISHAIGQLRQVQIPITGVILNDYSAKRDAGYQSQYYGYSYDYQPYRGQL